MPPQRNRPPRSEASNLTIRRLATLTGSTARALRHYEAIGLLTPLRARNGTRVYAPGECERAMEVARLRRLDLSLDLIGRVLDRQSSSEARGMILKQALTEQLVELEARIPMIRAALGDPAEALAG